MSVGQHNLDWKGTERWRKHSLFFKKKKQEMFLGCWTAKKNVQNYNIQII